MKGQQWKKHSIEFRQKIGLAPHAKPWTSRALLRGVRQTERTLDLLDVCWHCTTRGKSEAEIAVTRQHLMCDISQNIARRPWACEGFKTFTTVSDVYSFRLDRLVSEREKFALLGFPPNLRLEGLSEVALKDLVGDAMAVPSVSVFTWALLLKMNYPGLWSN